MDKSILKAINLAKLYKENKDIEYINKALKVIDYTYFLEYGQHIVKIITIALFNNID